MRACLAGNNRYTFGPARFVTAVQISAMHKNLYAAVQQELLKFVVLLHRTTEHVIPRRGEAPTWESPAPQYAEIPTN